MWPEPPPPENPVVGRALGAAIESGMPAESLALYARWWQLETWLRDLAYLELRAQRGVAWTEAVRAAADRQTQDAAYTHMLSADSQDPLAYLDVSKLTELIERRWDQMGYALLERSAWQGRLVDLSRIRHRIGHVRTPHPDDLGRLEQTLRDLERGAFTAYATYNDRWLPDANDVPNAIGHGWLHGKHEAAQRLIEHARRQYETRFRLRLSRRPWADRETQASPGAGFLWHAEFYPRERPVDIRRLWHDSQLDAIRPLIVHLLADHPWHVGFTFAAVDDDRAVSDAIGIAFDTVLQLCQPRFLSDEQVRRWSERATNVDYRVHAGSRWNTVEPATVPIDIFGAGGGVEAAPSW